MKRLHVVAVFSFGYPCVDLLFADWMPVDGLHARNRNTEMGLVAMVRLFSFDNPWSLSLTFRRLAGSTRTPEVNAAAL